MLKSTHPKPLGSISLVIATFLFLSCGMQSASKIFNIDHVSNVFLGPADVAGNHPLHLGVASNVSAASFCVIDINGQCISNTITATSQSVVGSKKIFVMASSVKPPVHLQLFNDNAPVRKVAIDMETSPTGPAIPINAGEVPNNYQNLVKMKKTLQDWAFNSSSQISYGITSVVQSQEINYIRVGGKTYNSKPKVLVYASVHGDEAIAAAQLLYNMHRMIDNFGKDQRVTTIMQNTDIFFIPVACPDGYAKNSREVEGQDPNRSFPWPGDKNKKPTQCIDALKKLFEREKPDAVLDYHASGRMWLLPWGYSKSAKFEEDQKGNLLRQFAKKLSELNGYRWGTIPSLLYEAPGASIDWFYIRSKEMGFNTTALGVEVGLSKRPSPSEIKTEADLNWEPLLYFLENAPTLFKNTWSTEYDPELAISMPVYSSLPEGFVPGQE